MRTLSIAAIRAMLSSSTGDVFLALLTIEHPTITTVRVVDNTESITSRGHTYAPFPFGLVLPEDSDQGVARAQLQISNVSRELVDEIRSLTEPASVTLEIIRAEDPDLVEVGPFVFDLKNASYTVDAVTAELGYEPVRELGFPAGSFTPDRFPGLF